MEKVNHQLLEKDFFIPNWDCSTIILGTFNPVGGTNVNYFYGRESNYFWKAISLIDKKKEDYYHSCIRENRDDHFKLMKDNKFGCIDIIKSVNCPIERLNTIVGNGYTDQNLFHGAIERIYQFEEIKRFIERIHSSDLKIINTVGQRFDNPAPVEFAIKLNDFKNFCNNKNVEFISSPSASAYAVRRGTTNFQDLQKFYKSHIFND